MSPDVPSSEYKQFLIAKWESIVLLREKFWAEYLAWKGEINTATTETTHEYISQLISMWAELYPKVKGRADQTDLVKTFEEFENYRFDPKKIISDAQGDPKLIIKLDKTLCEAVNMLKLTNFEG